MQEVVSQERMAYELWNARTEEDRRLVRARYRCVSDEDEENFELRLVEAA